MSANVFQVSASRARAAIVAALAKEDIKVGDDQVLEIAVGDDQHYDAMRSESKGNQLWGVDLALDGDQVTVSLARLDGGYFKVVFEKKVFANGPVYLPILVEEPNAPLVKGKRVVGHVIVEHSEGLVRLGSLGELHYSGEPLLQLPLGSRSNAKTPQSLATDKNKGVFEANCKRLTGWIEVYERQIKLAELDAVARAMFFRGTMGIDVFKSLSGDGRSLSALAKAGL